MTKQPGCLDIHVTPVFDKNYAEFNGDKRFIINQGGTRSSKTYSICQMIIHYCMTNPNKMVSIVRKTYPALAASVLVDFIEILQDFGIYDTLYCTHHKTKNEFRFSSGSRVSFYSIDNAQKIRGRKHDVVFINEGNDLYFDDFQQLNMRCESKIIIDWNPSDDESWILDILKRPEAVLIHSTFKDNCFLSDDLKREIENLVNVDETYYQIYTLGLVATRQEKVFNDWRIGEYKQSSNRVYCVDFGYNDPSTLLELSQFDGEPKKQLYIKQHIYESYLTTEALISKFDSLGIEKHIQMFCDSARPDQIMSLKEAGYNAMSSNKKIQEGLEYLKLHSLIVDEESVETHKELKLYSYKKIKGKVTDDPVDFNNHSIDAIRYGALGLKASVGAMPEFFTSGADLEIM